MQGFMTYSLALVIAALASYTIHGQHIDERQLSFRDLQIQWRRGQQESYSATADSEDMRIRFNKFTLSTNVDFLPLQADDYPFSTIVSDELKENSDAVSVMTDGDPALDHYDANVQHYLDAIGGGPTHASRDGSHQFWNDFREVMVVQFIRRSHVDPSMILRLPDLWSEMDVHQVAEAVHNEFPGYHQVNLLKWLWGQPCVVDHNVLPFRSKSDFVGFEVLMADLNTWAIGVVSPTNFYLKWHEGRARPEEIAYKIATGELTADDGVPGDIIGVINSMKLKSAADFTAYPEGSPRHPAWPAMHSAASSASFWLAVILNLTEEQYCEALRVDYAVAYARTVAGVHYPTDNTAGLKLGQEIIAEKLADHLAEKYGSDRDAVQKKIDSLRFDWDDFDSFNCPNAEEGY